MNFLYMTGQLVDYLEFPTGEPNLNLLSMCRPGLSHQLRFARQKSIAEEVETNRNSSKEREGHHRMHRSHSDSKVANRVRIAVVNQLQ